MIGAPRGIGVQNALQYARAGLDASKDAILRKHPAAKVLTFPTDVRDVKRAEEVVAATVANFGRLDILVANAGILHPMDKPFASKDPNGWWDVLEVNIRGTYNFIHFAVPELLKTKGQVVVLASSAAQVRCPNASEYCMSKHAIIRFAEFIKLEYTDIKVFAIDPGSVQTDLLDAFGIPMEPNSTAELAASTIQYVTSGKADYMNGRYICATWDLGEVERDWKEKIVAQNSLVSKLSLPV